MILTRLTLHNVGAYRGQHSIDLTPRADKPIVLVGALNGSGKTTLLEGVQLALYGRSARHLRKDATGYSDYLQSLINSTVNPREGASLKLDFTHRIGGRAREFSVLREWSTAGSLVRERLEVLSDGQLDVVLTDRWVEFIGAVLPVQIADLFFFDGERIEALAKPESSAEVLRTGVHALLGLDLVDNLSRSLLQLQRRLQRDSETTESQVQIKEIEARLRAQEEARQRMLMAEAGLQNEIDEAEKALLHVQERLRAEGGDLLEQRDVILVDIERWRAELEAIEIELRDVAGEAAPLNLVSDLMAEAVAFIESASGQSVGLIIQERLASKKKRLLDIFKDAGIERRAAERALAALGNEVAVITCVPADATWLKLLGGAVSEHVGSGVEECCADLVSLVTKWEAAAEGLLAAESRLAGVPAIDQVRDLMQMVAEAQVQLTALGERRAVAVAEREALERELARGRDTLDQLYQSRRDLDRVISHSTGARDVLAAFRLRVAAKKLKALEGRILENFQILLRKSDLVTRVSIDPDSFRLSVYGREGQVLPPDRLSAGERQLLAVAVLWSLAQASGRQLPVIIDTPLGRLDSAHRIHLVDNYFPRASHQVILLSTDEEVRDHYYHRLRPHLSHEYLISYREKDRTSAFEDGYFGMGAAA